MTELNSSDARWDVDSKATDTRSSLQTPYIAERLRFLQALSQIVDMKPSSDRLSVLDEVFADAPDLERQFGWIKLATLMQFPQRKREAFIYATRIMAIQDDEHFEKLFCMTLKLLQGQSEEIVGRAAIRDLDFAKVAGKVLRESGWALTSPRPVEAGLSGKTPVSRPVAARESSG